MAKPASRPILPYYLIAALCLAAALIAGWTPLAGRIDNYHYDWTLRLYPPPEPALESAILEIDDLTLLRYGGARNLRRTLALALDGLAPAKPRAVAIDLILAEESDADQDHVLSAAMSRTPNLILSSDLIANADQWEEPYTLFRPFAQAVGHVHADPDRYDGISREVQLEKAAHRLRRWALALEAFRLARGAPDIIESASDLRIGGLVIPVPRRGNRGRPMFIRYRGHPIPRVSVRQLIEDPATVRRLSGKVVFVGVTSQSQARDRLMTPVSTITPMPGVEIHAHIYETIAQREFLWPAGNVSIVLACLMLAMVTATVFAFLTGWQAYGVGAIQILWAHALPHLLFQSGIIFPLLAPAASAWLSVICCAAWQYSLTRKQLSKSEADRSRYQQAIHFVSHEMRSPLTAIQGSSELMSRYNLSDEKRKQIAQMINSESKRLARMIQAFLDVERLGEGQMELKREPFSARDVVIVCLERARPLAARKRIRLEAGELSADELLGDRELMEYAVYNLLTNAVKYSPPETQVLVTMRRLGERLHLAVRDQGIGMDEKELTRIGTKFYRTTAAEKSGEVGTGIGLSIVNQIVERHGGRIEVSSAPGSGSCFTIIVPLHAAKPAAEVKG
ncbi:MAG: CHASE2 domain-containing protein [Bryobacterales bacterium]|nr:CHASE2 domain-containing protein [Bryobacterales bacterium]